MKTLTTTTKASKKTLSKLRGDIESDLVMNGFLKENRITGLTNGLFSLISLIHSTLKITGNANVLVSTWSAGFYDVKAIKELMESGLINEFKIILDRSFESRQKGYSLTVTELFTKEQIRTTNTHSKYVLIWNEEWNICIRSSMNLNENKRCENFDIDNDKDVFDLFMNFSNNLFEIQESGIIATRTIVDKNFDTLFGVEKGNKEKDWTKFTKWE